MGSKQSVYQNITVRWKSEAAGNLDSILILSPYITGPTSETVTRDVNPLECEIYTLFDAEIFASGGSSLQAIKKLSQRGFTLYHLPNLHAKVLLTSEGFASVGSQNLTGRGTRSLEASSVIQEEKQVAELRKLVENWIETRELITPEMILDMEDLLKPIIKSFKVAQKAAAEVDSLIVEREKARQEERQRLAEQKRLEAEKFGRREAEEAVRHKAEESVRREAALRLSRLQETISDSVQSQTSIRCSVKLVRSSSWYSSSYRYSLKVSDPRYEDFLSWNVSGQETHSLGRLNRYVCLIEKSGQFGWGRVGKRTITYFGKGVRRSKKILLGDIYCQLQFRAVWSRENSHYPHNLVIQVKPIDTSTSIEVQTWFSLNSVEMLKVVRRSENNDVLQLEEWIHNNEKEFKSEMLKLFLDSFTYEESLSGVEAREFFGNHNEDYRVNLHLIEGRPLFVISH